MTEIKIENYAYDEPTDSDYLYSEYENFIDKKEDEWISSPFPENTIVWNQGNTPACTCYSLTHIFNANNLLEDERLQENRDQIDPKIPRWLFCAKRGYSDKWSSIQTMAQFFKDRGMIEWYVTIKNIEKDQIEKIKKALDMWKFISTGSSNGDRTTTKKTWVYTLRKDWKFVWHAWCIVDYSDGYFRAVNSYGDKRWPYWGKFKVPFNMIDKIYSKLVIIDKDDSWQFSKLSTYKKAQEMLKIARELYLQGNSEQKKYFEKIELWNNIKMLYK